MEKTRFLNLLSAANWRELFIEEMGWNNPRGQIDLLPIEIDDVAYSLHAVAQFRGFQILSCEVQTIPTQTTCRKIDARLRTQANDYICIFSAPQSEHHCWVCPVKNNEKRDLVLVEYATRNQAEFLYQKMDDLVFEIDDDATIVDVRARVHGIFKVNSEKITKDFYAGFRRQHDAFAKHITGIGSTDKSGWYASVMLNRLMFCYFIQKKGFLNGDVHYLANKLKESRDQNGKNRFYQSFYKDFLLSLFHDGLNNPRHEEGWEQRFGRIPYLNGGMFDHHQIEQEYKDKIDIDDKAFENLFAFFDTYQWHLDTRLTASGKDINPDVLGYIFEQYINDRAAMGAYYTKEDITEYIGKNCILPFLFDRVSSHAFIWDVLKASGDKYIYDAVKKGYSASWKKDIPGNIRCGLDTAQPNLLERRKDWNTLADAKFALPTEIWRETIERLTRCDELIKKIASGEIASINDFITCNLDIRSFAQDMLSAATDHKFILHFYHALQKVTILDPTCGSGAFLFAALNILEPLYEICITRMQEFHAKNKNLFKDELGEIERKYRSNIQYFIYKSIILRNLYGVDIMVEATEIAKLRLFLKMVAVVEVDLYAENMGLDPLPDIDFNIRCGNTLVGYATEKEFEDSLVNGDMFARASFMDKVHNEMAIVAKAYETFKKMQMVQDDDMVEYKTAKRDLRNRLAALNDLLNQNMYCSQFHLEEIDLKYQSWLASHQPFHWIAEFYDIIHGNGGFDVIIGNPPYVEYNKKDKVTKKAISDRYKIIGYETESCGNLYAFVIERSYSIINNWNNIGFIVPLTLVSNNNMSSLRDYITSFGTVWFSNFEIRPAKLFEGAEQRLTIFIVRNTTEIALYSTPIIRWKTENREMLFKGIHYARTFYNERIWRLSTRIETSIYEKFISEKMAVNELSRDQTTHKIDYRTAGIRYWIVFLCDGFGTESLSNKSAYYSSKQKAKYYMAAFNSSLFWWYYSINFDMFNLKDYMIFGFRLSFSKAIDLSSLASKLEADMNSNKITQSVNSATRGLVKTSVYSKKHSKPIIDEIDKVLAKHYGFTEEELDFIINYDIKYRMGDGLNREGDGE